VIARRAVYEAQAQAERYVAPWRARRFDGRRLLRACEAHDLDSLWARLAARPYPAHTARNPRDSSDVEVAWDLSRLQWLMPAGQAYLLTGEERYAEAVRAVLESWIDANPYAQTVNWSSTMEAALRILSWTQIVG
jgi:hypothetical protein